MRSAFSLVLSSQAQEIVDKLKKSFDVSPLKYETAKILSLWLLRSKDDKKSNNNLYHTQCSQAKFSLFSCHLVIISLFV